MESDTIQPAGRPGFYLLGGKYTVELTRRTQLRAALLVLTWGAHQVGAKTKMQLLGRYCSEEEGPGEPGGWVGVACDVICAGVFESGLQPGSAPIAVTPPWLHVPPSG